MAKRKSPLAGARGQTPGGSQAAVKKEKELSWAQEQFVYAFVDNGGNATRAYKAGHPNALISTCEVEGCRYLKIPKIISAIDERKEYILNALNIDRLKILRAIAARAFVTMDEFTEVMRRPKDKESYRGLGDKRFAIDSIKEGQWGNEIKLADKQEALNELWDKLGLANSSNKKDRFATPERILAALGLTSGDAKE